MANIDLLEAALLAKAAQIDDSVQQYKCIELISQYIDALTAQGSSAATDVQSYSIAGRSVSRRGQSEQGGQVASLERQINRLLYGICTVADFSGMHDNERVA